MRGSRVLVVAGVAAALALVGCSGTTGGRPEAQTADDTARVADPEPAQQVNTDGLPDFAKNLVEQVANTPWPIRPADTTAPLSAVTVDADRAVTQTIGPSGGEIAVTTGDVTYTLRLPADALVFDTAITLTPIVTIGGLDLPDGTLHGVDLQPHGLQLGAMADLEITGISDAVLGFAYSDAGLDLRPAPIAPDPDRLAVYVSHFSGAGVGPFAALGDALGRLPSSSGPAADLARGSAQVHNKAPGTTVDQLSDLYAQMLRQLDELRLQAAGDCQMDISMGMDAYTWVELDVGSGIDGDRDSASLKAAIRGMVDSLVSCWDDPTNGGCIVPSPGMIRQLQGIKALLVRWQALDEAASATGKRAVGDYAYCSATGWTDYSYSGDEGHSSITASLTLKLESKSGQLEAIEERSSYTIGVRSSGYQPDCPSTTVGYGSFGFDELPPGSEIPPTVEVDRYDEDHVAVMVGPVYHFVAVDCHDTTDGWEGGLLLACNPDGTGADSLIGTFVDGSDDGIVSFECDDPSLDAKTTGLMLLSNAMDEIIPPGLWD